MNVIPDEAVIKGMVRSLEPGLADELFQKVIYLFIIQD